MEICLNQEEGSSSFILGTHWFLNSAELGWNRNTGSEKKHMPSFPLFFCGLKLFSPAPNGLVLLLFCQLFLLYESLKVRCVPSSAPKHSRKVFRI